MTLLRMYQVSLAALEMALEADLSRAQRRTFSTARRKLLAVAAKREQIARAKAEEARLLSDEVMLATTWQDMTARQRQHLRFGVVHAFGVNLEADPVEPLVWFMIIDAEKSAKILALPVTATGAEFWKMGGDLQD